MRGLWAAATSPFSLLPRTQLAVLCMPGLLHVSIASSAGVNKHCPVCSLVGSAPPEVQTRKAIDSCHNMSGTKHLRSCSKALKLQMDCCLPKPQPHLKSRSKNRGAAAKAATLRFFTLPSNMSAS